MRIDSNATSILSVGAITVAAGAIGWRLISKKNDDGIPEVPSWIPHIGSTAEYFTSVVCFMEKYFNKYKGAFKATILGRTWYFVTDPADIRKVFRSSERNVSMVEAISIISQGLLPTEEIEGKNAPEHVKKLFRGKKMEGPSSTPYFVHALKHLPAWIPQLQEAFQYNFATYLQNEGEKDLFEWATDLIGLATSRVMMGKDASIDEVLEWMYLVKECDVESAFSGQGVVKATKTFVELAIKGERPIYVKTRQFAYPYIDKEIENYLAGKPENGSVVCSLVHTAGARLKAKENPDVFEDFKVRIANDLILFTFAAITNSFGAAAWSLFHILKNTDGCGDKVRSEIASQTDISVLSETLEMMVLEILRLYSPGTTTRLVKKPLQLPSDPSKIIPTGSLICIGGAMAGREAEAYPDPCKFDPGRFDPASRDQRSSENFFGFGFGAHPCVGRKFATSEIAIFVSEALKTFDFELVETNYKEAVEKNNTMAVAMTSRMINNVPNHPILDPAQPGSIWRPIHPIMIKYKRKSGF